MAEKRKRQEDAYGKPGIASSMRALGKGKRCEVAFCPHSQHSLPVVVGDICKLLPPGPVHRIFEPLKRNNNGQFLCKCRW